MAKKNKVMTAKLNDGGSITVIETGKGFIVKVKQGYKETPEERLERLAYEKRGGAHTNKKHAQKRGYGKGGRKGVKQNLRAEG